MTVTWLGMCRGVSFPKRSSPVLLAVIQGTVLYVSFQPAFVESPFEPDCEVLSLIKLNKTVVTCLE